MPAGVRVWGKAKSQVREFRSGRSILFTGDGSWGPERLSDMFCCKAGYKTERQALGEKGEKGSVGRLPGLLAGKACTLEEGACCSLGLR